MTLWEWIPPYAEQITINQVEETLSKFEQLIPDSFVELGQPKKYWGSTEGLDKPLCERYTFKHDDKLTTLDITQGLNDELELNPKNNFCVKEEVLSRLPEEGGITINEKEEIFLRKSFTVDNLKEDIKELLEKIEKLKKEKEKLKKELEKEQSWWDKWLEDWNTNFRNSCNSKKEFRLYENDELPKLAKEKLSKGRPHFKIFFNDFNSRDVMSLERIDGYGNENAEVWMTKLIYLYYRDK